MVEVFFTVPHTSAVADIMSLSAGSAAISLPNIAGLSMALMETLVLADRAAASQATVLLTGESGTGKELIARHIHGRSSRAACAFVTIDCGGSKDPLLESECFGHVRGSFVGAQRDTVGKLELTDSGTVFFDEISCLSMRMQVRLLRFLESGEVQPLGSKVPGKRIDVRLIAATQANLTQLAHAGAFREDLLYRLRVAHIHVPPLRDRPDDIGPIVAHTVSKAGRAVRFTPEALAVLKSYPWPGNVRELQTAVEQLVWMSGVTVIDVDHLPPAFRRPGARVASIVERRRQLADELYAGLVAHTISFWGELYPLFLARDLTRHDLRELLRRGLRATAGSYRGLVSLFGMEPHDYKRLLNFLAAHDCSVDPRPFRKPPAADSGSFSMAMIGDRRIASESRVERSSAES